MKLSDELKGLIAFSTVILLVVLAFSYYFFGFTGVRVIFAIILTSLPFYLILNNFDFSEGEKFVFSVLMGLALFPSLAYLIGLIISFKLAIVAAFVVFMAAAAVLWKFKKQK